MKFLKRGDRERKQQKFDKEKITITKGGQTYNVYDAIQAANVDTDIYEVLKKYHCTVEAGIEFMQQHGGVKGVYADIIGLQKRCSDMADIFQIQKEAQTMFENLPVEVKTKYGNDLNQFLKDMEKQQTQEKTEPKQPEGENNETK